ncbi:hypothetical protein B4U80_13618 [Leptotrombidium deliense]|uniref:Phytanoyl-CoA dioxygenase n=1 Tax=Leptotrombidium deliense TaxID=299467 RepID=A0A443SSR9_9ACAR|nr:hypothetical protein B4U80_13618 [Leptotrombidium deliense]
MRPLMALKMTSVVKTIASSYFEKGFAVVRNFLPMSDISKIAAESDAIINKHWKEIEESVKNGDGLKNGVKCGDFVFSLNNVGFDENFNVKSNRRNTMNFVGFKLHAVSDLFKRVVFTEEAKLILKHLEFRHPVVYQSSIIHKAPGAPSLSLHQDEAYLNNEPKGCGVNFWIAIEDATEDNGSLVIYPGSHRTVKCRKVGLTEQGAYDDIDKSKLVKVMVKKGDLVLLNSLVVHGSEANNTNAIQRSLEFSVYDKHRVQWSKENFMQDGDTYKFTQMY